LAAVGVAAEDPAAVVVPAGEVNGVGVVAEDEGGFVDGNGREDFFGRELFGPEVVEADDFEAGGFGGGVAENGDAGVARDGGGFFGDFFLGPVDAVVVVAEDAEGAEFSFGKVREHAAGLWAVVAIVASEVASVDDEVGGELVDGGEGLFEEVVADFGADVEVGELDKAFADE
jgi:hypothetical protein